MRRSKRVEKKLAAASFAALQADFQKEKDRSLSSSLTLSDEKHNDKENMGHGLFECHLSGIGVPDPPKPNLLLYKKTPTTNSNRQNNPVAVVTDLQSYPSLSSSWLGNSTGTGNLKTTGLEEQDEDAEEKNIENGKANLEKNTKDSAVAISSSYFSSSSMSSNYDTKSNKEKQEIKEEEQIDDGDEDDEKDGFFPPTVFTDAMYSKGILVHAQRQDYKNEMSPMTTVKGPKTASEVYTSATLKYNYFAPLSLQHPNTSRYQYGPCCLHSFTSTTASSSSSSSATYNPVAKQRHLPVLTKAESTLWLHNYAAVAAAQRRFPLEAVRLLGTITLFFDETERTDCISCFDDVHGSKSGKEKKARTGKKAGRSRKKQRQGGKGQKDNGTVASFEKKIGPFQFMQRESLSMLNQNRRGHGRNCSRRLPPKDRSRITKKFSRAMALKEARAEFPLSTVIDDETDDDNQRSRQKERDVERRAAYFQHVWKGIVSDEPKEECWNYDYGGFDLSCIREDDRYVPLQALMEWVEMGRSRSDDNKEGVGDKSTWRRGKGGRSKQPKRLNKDFSATVSDRNEGKTLSLYNGLRKVPVDAMSVLESLMEMSSPHGLYDVPLIMPYAVAKLVKETTSTIREANNEDDVGCEEGGARKRSSKPLQRGRKRKSVGDDEGIQCSQSVLEAKKNDAIDLTVEDSNNATFGKTKSSANFARAQKCKLEMLRIGSNISSKTVAYATKRVWKVRIGVYANRLLPEVLTWHHLHVIMSALDEGSYRVSEPLHLPPLRDPNDPVFQCSPYPIVDIDAEGVNCDSDSDDSINAGNHSSLDDDDVIMNDDRNDTSSSSASSLLSSTVNCVTSAKSKVKRIRADETIRDSTRDDSRISAFTVRGFLKLLENTGNDVSSWPEIEKKISSTMQLNLMLHQKHAVCWMVQMESLGGFGINSILWEEREFFDGGKYYYSPALGQIRLGRPPVMRGGLLCDEMGLGKTIEVLGLILATMDELKDEAAGAVTRKRVGCRTHATLIIVPPALVMQWVNEIRKSVGDALEVHVFDAKSCEFRAKIKTGGRRNGLRKPDIVVTTYGALDKTKSSRILESTNWGRIVLDEMQEIRSSTTAISRNCEKLPCQRRWMLSGTPLFEGIDDLKGELNFLRLEPYAHRYEDGFFDFSITNHWNHRSMHGLETLRILGLLMLRRAKSMTICKTNMPLLGLKGLTVEFVPVPQDPSERALYCWMEYLVSQELAWSKESRDLNSRNLCLRLLREFCISPILLNGGLGVSSQLETINTLMIKLNRKIEYEQFDLLENDENRRGRRKKAEKTRVVSCDEALRYLTQVQHAVNVREGFVSDVSFGGGGGAANRNRAEESVEDQYKAAEADVTSALQEHASARKKKAKALWHLALEKVTSGDLLCCHAALKIPPKYSSLWKWRFAITSLMKKGILQRSKRLPSLLTRGWRPSPIFLRRDLYAAHPHFAWAHPIALQLDGIPNEVTVDDITESVHRAAQRSPDAMQYRDMLFAKLNRAKKPEQIEKLKSDLSQAETSLKNARHHDSMMKRVKVTRSTNYKASSSWNATLQFSDERDLRFVMRKASSANGIALSSSQKVAQMETWIETATAKLQQAESENKVYPCPINARSLADAKKEFERATLGLRIILDEKGTPPTNDCRVTLSRSVGPFRSMSPQTRMALEESTARSLLQLSEKIVRSETAIAVGRQKMARLTPALNRVSEEIQAMSAFETLEALAACEFEKTKCPICLGPFCEGVPTGRGAKRKDTNKFVAMINCGHFFCVKCIETYAHERMSNYYDTSLKCPSCRRVFSLSRDIIHVDPTLKEDEKSAEIRREEAKRKVREASKMLEESNGQLEAAMWYDLFLSFDLPVNADRRAHAVLTAIPRDVLAHFRAATGLAVSSSRNDKPRIGAPPGAGRSSKVRALLSDLPRKERSVVFTGSRECVKHLVSVFNDEGIGCRSLYNGQASSDSEQAVSEWEAGGSVPSIPVLVVQAGAAASGLTLTAASKIFLMEPFSRQEEEHQAYARCHRFGQDKEVFVKCYYAPVTVESRLLEWRKKATVVSESSRSLATGSGARLIYSSILEETDDKGGEDNDGVRHRPADGSPLAEDTRRSMFLLGLLDENGNPLGFDESDIESGDDGQLARRQLT